MYKPKHRQIYLFCGWIAGEFHSYSNSLSFLIYSAFCRRRKRRTSLSMGKYNVCLSSLGICQWSFTFSIANGGLMPGPLSIVGESNRRERTHILIGRRWPATIHDKRRQSLLSTEQWRRIG